MTRVSRLWLAFSVEGGQAKVMSELPEDLGRVGGDARSEQEGPSSRLWSSIGEPRGNRLNHVDSQSVKASLLTVCDLDRFRVSLLQVLPFEDYQQDHSHSAP